MRSTNTLFRTLLAAVIVTLCSFSVRAQFFPTAGIKGGLSLPTIAYTEDAERISGLVGGIYVNIDLPGSPISLQPEILYAQYGSERSTGTIELDYIQFPLLANFLLLDTSAPVRPWFEFGPYYAINLRKEFKPASGVSDAGVTELISDTDFGAAIGAGINVSRFMVSLRYTFGLTDLFEPIISENEVNDAMQITIAYRFL